MVYRRRDVKYNYLELLQFAITKLMKMIAMKYNVEIVMKRQKPFYKTKMKNFGGARFATPYQN